MKNCHELILAKREWTKTRNIVAINMSTDIKFSKAQVSKITQSGGSFGFLLRKLGEKALKIVAISLAKDNLPGFASNLVSNEINRFEIKISGKGAVRGLAPLVVSNKDKNDIIKIIKSLEDSNALIDGVTETIKHKLKSNKVDFFLLC